MKVVLYALCVLKRCSAFLICAHVLSEEVLNLLAESEQILMNLGFVRQKFVHSLRTDLCVCTVSK